MLGITDLIIMIIPAIPFLYSFVYFLSCPSNSIDEASYWEIFVILFNLAMIEITDMFFVMFCYYPEKIDLSLGIVNIITILLIQDMIFYTFHRIMHEIPILYKNVHSTHHSRYGPIYALYVNPLDNVLTNIFPLFLSVILFPIPLWMVKILIAYQMYNVTKAHRKGSLHEVHHLNMKKRFGTVYFMDIIFETYWDN